MIRAVLVEGIGDHGHVDLALLGVGAGRRVGGVEAVDPRAPDLDVGQLAALPAQAGEHAAHIVAEIAAERAAGELRLAALPRHRHRAGAVRHGEALRNVEGQPQHRVAEGPPVDDPLPRIVAIEHAVDRREETVAVAVDAARRGRPGPLQRTLDAAAGIGMGAGELGLGACVASGQPRVEIVLGRKRSQHRPHRRRIIAAAREIADAEIVRFIFLLAREAQRVELRALARDLAERAVAGQHPEQHGKTARDGRGAVALRAVARGDMADLVAEHRGEFGFVVHQRDELARDIDIAARDREGVVDRRVEQGDPEVARRVRQARLDRDPLPDLGHIGILRAAIGAAIFLEQLRMRLGALPHLALRNAARSLGT
ncbi:hypothetical protein VF10_10945, partial [Nostoc linckia z13]